MRISPPWPLRTEGTVIRGAFWGRLQHGAGLKEGGCFSLIRWWQAAEKSLSFHFSLFGHFVFGLLEALENGGRGLIFHAGLEACQQTHDLALALFAASSQGTEPACTSAGECTLCHRPPEGCSQDTEATATHRQQPLCLSGSCLWTLGQLLDAPESL